MEGAAEQAAGAGGADGRDDDQRGTEAVEIEALVGRVHSGEDEDHGAEDDDDDDNDDDMPPSEEDASEEPPVPDEDDIAVLVPAAVGAEVASTGTAPTGGEVGDEELVHSVFVVLPEEFGGIPIEMIFDDMVQDQVLDTCRRSMSQDTFRRLWPGGRRALKEALWSGIQECGRGPVAHGLNKSQAQALARRLSEFVRAEVGVDREAAARVASAGNRGGDVPSGRGSGPIGTTGGPSSRGATDPARSGEDNRIHSVYFVPPPDMQGLLDMILPDILPRIIEVCRRHREFGASWPGGPPEMERALRAGVEENGRGPLLHGLPLSQAETLRAHLAEFVEAEVAEDRTAAARIRERERRSRPPPQPPPLSLLSRFRPGARATITASSTEALERAHRGFDAPTPQMRECLGKSGVVAGYTPVDGGGGTWFVRVLCDLDSGPCVGDWSPSLIQVEAEKPRDQATSGGDEAGAILNSAVADAAAEVAAAEAAIAAEAEEAEDDEDDEDGDEHDEDEEDDESDGDDGPFGQDQRLLSQGDHQPAHSEVLLVSDEDLLEGDDVVFHHDNRWHVGRVVVASGVDRGGDDGTEASFDVTAEGGQMEVQGVPRRHIHMVVAVQDIPRGLREGVLVRITSDLARAKALQRNRWTDDLLPCLGQLGIIIEAKDRRKMVVTCPAGGLRLWNASCLEVDKSEGLRCLDLHEHPLWRCSSLPGTRACAGGCGAKDLKEAYCCLRSGSCSSFALCSSCAAPYLDKSSAGVVWTRHHLCPLRHVVLPRGPKESRWLCAGAMAPGGCRSQAAPSHGAAFCAECEFLVCDACLADEELGEATERTRRGDVEALPQSASRIQAALCAHPSEIFALAQAGLFQGIGRCLAARASTEKTVAGPLGIAAAVESVAALSSGGVGMETPLGVAEDRSQGLTDLQVVRSLAMDLGAWLASAAPERVHAGPLLVDVGDGQWVEACALAEDTLSFDGMWTDEIEPGRLIRKIEGHTLHPPVEGPDAGDDHHVIEIRGCGLAEFDGCYVPDGKKNQKTRYCKLPECVSTDEYFARYCRMPDSGMSRILRLANLQEKLPQTLNYSSGSWYICHNYGGSWYQAVGDGELPPGSGWSVGQNGRAPAPTSVERIRSPGTERAQANVAVAAAARAAAIVAAAAPAAFTQLPSVGTWLRHGQITSGNSIPAMPVTSESSAAVLSLAPPSVSRLLRGRGLPVPASLADLEGAWRRLGPDDQAVIDGARLAWPDGSSALLAAGVEPGSWRTDFHGEAREACLIDRGARLMWSNGDVWERALPMLEGEALALLAAEEGFPVNYRGMHGCSIRHVIDRDRVVVHIPGVGDEEAEISDFSLGVQDARALLGSSEAAKPLRLERLSKDSFVVDQDGALRCARLTADGHLVWSDHNPTWIRLERCLKCLHGHLLRRSRHTTPWTCSECDEKRSEKLRLRCGTCDYNYCRSCSAIRSWEHGYEVVEDALFTVGCEAEVRVAAGCGSKIDEWLRCTVQGHGTKKGSFNVTVCGSEVPDLPEHRASWTGKELTNVHPARIRPCSLSPVMGPVDSLWRYCSPNDIAIGIRSVPDIDGPRDGQLEHGQTFRVSEHRMGPGGVLFLHLYDKRGWVFDKKPGVGTMCVLLRQRETMQAADRGVEGADNSDPCAVALAEAKAEAESTWTAISSVRPALDIAGPRNHVGDFLRAELQRELRRGTHCSRSQVQVLMEAKANLLAVEGGDDLLASALRHKCHPAIIEALLVAHAPVVASVLPVLRNKNTIKGGSVGGLVSEASGVADGNTQMDAPGSSVDATERDPDVGRTSVAAEKELPQKLQRETMKAVLALGEPRLAALLAERSSVLASEAAVAMDGLADRLEQPEETIIAEEASNNAEDKSGQESMGVSSSPGASPLVQRSDRHLRAPRDIARLDLADRAALTSAARGCAVAARRLAATPRPRGNLADMLRIFGQELLTPLLHDEGAGGVLLLESGSRLGGLLEALGGAGYEPTDVQADHLASVIAGRLAEEPDGGGSGRGIVMLLLSLLDAFSPEAPASATLRRALHRHGIVVSLERLVRADGVAFPMRGATDVGPLRGMAESLVRRLDCAQDMESEVAAASPAAQLVKRLPDPKALSAIIQLLKDGKCTPYELGALGAPQKMLPAFEVPGGAWPWLGAPALDESSLAMLVNKLQELLGLCETFPMAALSVRGDGLMCVLQPHTLVLDGPGGRRELKVEPLLPLSDLESFLRQTTPIENLDYLKWCEQLRGQLIVEQPARSENAWRAARVTGFRLVHKLPVHTVKYEVDGSEAQLSLHLRKVVVLRSSDSFLEETEKVETEQVSDTISHLLTAGNKVQARFEDGSWCRAVVEKDNGDGTCTVRWENGTCRDTVKGPDDLRALPTSGKSVCQRVQVTQDGVSFAGVSVWEHSSGAYDVIDQEGCYLPFLPASNVTQQRPQQHPSRDRPLPAEIRTLTMDRAPQTLPAMPALERIFSAVDRNYRPQDFQYKNPSRKIGGPEGEPLQTPGQPDASPRKASLEQLVRTGTPAPHVRVVFFTVPPIEDTPPLSPPLLNRASVGSQSSSPTRDSLGRAGSEPASPEHAVSSHLGPASAPPSVPPSPSCRETGKPITPTDTVLQALLHLEPGGRAELPDPLRLRYEIRVDFESHGQSLASLQLPGMAVPDGFAAQSADAADAASSGGPVAPVLTLLRHLRRQWQELQIRGEVVHWDSARLNRKLKDLLAQPLLTAAVAAPAWVMALPLAYPFLFERTIREQLLRCSAFGTSHAILWLQRQSIQERYGDQLRRVEGQLEGRMDVTERIVNDARVFIGPARSDFVTFPTREGLLEKAECVVELTFRSKSMLEVKFADEGGFGDGVTQSFYTAVAAELSAKEAGGMSPLSGPHAMWAEHLPASVVEHKGRAFLHARRGLFPRPCCPGSPESEMVCQRFRFLGRLMAKALRDGFVVPLSLCDYFFKSVLGEDLPLSALPSPGDGLAGEFVGAAAKFAQDLRIRAMGLDPEGARQLLHDAAKKPGWGETYLCCVEGAAKDWSFNEYAQTCCITFCETGVGGAELCEGGSNKTVTVDNLEEFVEHAAYWWLREGIAPQVLAFKQGVEDVCASAAIWAFEASEMSSLFCGGFVNWDKEQLKQHLRPKGGLEAADLEMLIDVLDGLALDRRGQFLEFVTACPRLPPGGLGAAEIAVTPANPAGSLPRARTCTKELKLPKYKDKAELEKQLLWALDNAEGLYDDDRMI